nr:hypothetical protein GCM10017611_13280 [Rhodococcus wratislaviensis]
MQRRAHLTRTTILARAAHQNSALEALIELSYALVDHGHDDPLICGAFRLVFDLGDPPTPARPALFATWTACCRDLAARVAAEGDFRPGTDPGTLAAAVVATAFGSRVLRREPRRSR